MTVEQDTKKRVDRRIHGLKVRLGKAQAEGKRAETLPEKIALYGRAKALEQELALLQRSYWVEVEVERLEAEAD